MALSVLFAFTFKIYIYIYILHLKHKLYKKKQMWPVILELSGDY